MIIVGTVIGKFLKPLFFLGLSEARSAVERLRADMQTWRAGLEAQHHRLHLCVSVRWTRVSFKSETERTDKEITDEQNQFATLKP
eukprot:4053123-Amphidinium_carterae.1